MAEKYKNRYRIASSRARWWNYENDGSYFVTICTRNKVHYFGEVENFVMNTSDSGRIVQAIWNEIPKRFSYIKLGEFVVMPNHIHGIITIEKLRDDHVDSDVETRLIASLHPNLHDSKLSIDHPPPIEGLQHGEFGTSNKSNTMRGGITGIHNPMLHQNLSRVLRWFTGRVTFEIHKNDPDFNWQRRFFDHIIKNQNEIDRITRYIKRNPLNWKWDRFFNRCIDVGCLCHSIDFLK